jgi:hypothetical protein
MNLIQRVQAPTPAFFSKLRTIGITLGGLSTLLATAPTGLPAFIAKLAAYLAVAGGVMTAVSQVAVKNDQ